MKHKIVTLICVVALCVFGVVVYQSAHSGALHRAAVQAKAAAVSAKNEAVKQYKAKLAALNEKRLIEVCSAELKFYNSVSAAQQAKIGKPNCSLQPIE